MTRKLKKGDEPMDSLVTFMPLKTFTGWPFGYDVGDPERRAGTQFKVGWRSIAVPAEFAALMHEKGLAADDIAPEAAGE